MVDIIGIGNPLLDKTINVDEAFLAAHDLIKGTMHLIDERTLQRMLEQLAAKDVVNGAGGSVGNTLAAAANLGGKTLFIGMIGNNTEGDIYDQLITSAGITSGLIRADKEQGTCLVMITPDGERTMATHLGAAIMFNKSCVDEAVIKNAKILHLEGYQLDSNEQAEAALYALQLAKKHGVKVSIDLSDPLLVKRHQELVKLIVEEYANIVFLNELEAAAHTGKEPEDAALALAKSVEIAVVKVGEQGSFIASKEALMKIAPYQVHVVNTTGAGDAYAGAFLQSLIDGKDLRQAGTIASFVAAKVVSQEGSRVERFMKREAEQVLARNLIADK